MGIGVWAPGVPCDWGLGLLLEGALLVPVGVRVGAKEGGLHSPTGSGGDERRQGSWVLPFLRLSVVSSFLRAGAPALGLWAEGEDAGGWASAVPAASLGLVWTGPGPG